MTTLDSHAHASTDHAGAGHDHDHPPFLAHHWATPTQQFEAGKLGMWLFLATEFLLFGGLFAGYAVLRYNHPEMFEYGARFLDTKMGAINTVILILSSLTMALAVSAAQLGRQRALVVLLGLTFLGGAGFMVVKYFEYTHKFHGNIVWGTKLYVPPDREAYAAAIAARGSAETAEGAQAAPAAAVPGTVVDGIEIPRSAVARASHAPAGIDPGTFTALEAARHEVHMEREHGSREPDPRLDANRPPNQHLFFGIYFCMTGLHGIHVLIGMAVIGWLMVRSMLGHFGPAYFTPVDLGGLYWHVVDLIWIFLFPLLYLI
ncbi:MAG: cytochrome c oxidase subunit 3 family protein [Phycisphaeraceae bacterium]|nr:cytochrome c oxidase subunit 3 family protein [Phycisphaeraceae bacterium]